MSEEDGATKTRELGIFDLPDELIERILNGLRAKDILRLETTCRRAYDACEWLYWRRLEALNLVTFLRNECRVDVSNAYRFDVASAGLVRKCGPFLKTLDLSKFGPLEYGLRLGLEHSVIEYGTKLRSIEINNRLLERDWLLQLSAATSENLRHLSICHVYVRNCGGLNDCLLGALLRQWRHLETLVARENKQLRLSCYGDVPRTINTLDVQGCNVHSGNVHALLSRCPKLTSLSLTFAPDFGQLSPELAERIRELNVDSVGSLNGDLFRAADFYVNKAVSNLFNLNVLTVNSHLVNDAFFKLVAENLRNLRELHLPGARPGFLSSATLALLELTPLPLVTIGMRANPMSRTLLMICYKFEHLVEIDASFALKERDLVDAWQDIRSNTLEKLQLAGFCRMTQDKATESNRILSLLRPTCPSLKTVVL